MKANRTQSIALMLLLVVSVFAAAVPSIVNGQTVVARDITLLIAANPNPVGVGQYIQILCWADIYPNVYIPVNSTNPVPGGPNLVGGITYARFHNYTFTLTKPDGTIETRVFPITDPLGSAYFTYTPTVVGTYTVVCVYPGESFVDGVQDLGSPIFKANAIFNPARSRTISFVVQSTGLDYYPENQPPTDYWARPIDASNRNWGNLGSNWLAYGQQYGIQKDYWTNFQPYGQAPNSAHVLWVNQWANGGVAGGELGEAQYYTGESYQIKFAPIIINGRLYANTKVGNSVTQGYACFDLRTGKQLFARNDTTISIGFQYDFEWENAHGVIDFLIAKRGTFMDFYDPMNGERAFTIQNATSNGAFIQNNTAGIGYTNDLTEYIIANNRLILWSFSKCVAPTSGSSWAPSQTVNYEWAKGIVYNVSLPKPANSASYAFGTGGGAVDGRMIVARSVNNTLWPPTLYLVGVRCSDGQILWTSNTTLINDPGIWRGGGGTHLSSDAGVYLNYKKETQQVIAWDIANGQVKYTTDARTDSDWGSYTSGWPMDSAYGKFYVGAYDGYMYAYDLATGDFLWKYYAGNAGLETPYGSYPFFLGIPYGMTVADGKIFAPTGEHSPNVPMYRGERLHVIDVNTGDAVWTVQGWWLGNAIADGSWTALNGYDGRVYNFYKGLTQMTVSAPQTTVASGSSVLIQGTILDLSPAQPGTPCVSRDSMTAWMEYLHMDQPKPDNVTGVPVKLEAISADGTVTSIGTVMSDLNGYATTWNAPSEGVYTIVASFATDESYGSSQSSTRLSVGPAATTINVPSASDVAGEVVSQLPVQTPVPTAPSASDVAQQVISQLPAVTNIDIAIIAIVVVALLIGLVNVVLLLKKKQ
jgi:hypothetical protein